MFGQPEYQATAKLGTNGELSVKVTAFCGYGSTDGDGNFARSASKSVEVTLDDKAAKAVTDALTAAIASEPLLGQQVVSDAAEGFAVANKKGETL